MEEEISTVNIVDKDEQHGSKGGILFMAGKLKIAMLGHKRIPSREGGIEIVAEELSARLVQLGHHVSGAEFDGEQLSEYKGIKIRTVPTIERKGLAAMTSSFFAAVKAAFGHYDIVHIHAEGPAAMCWIPKLCGKRVVVTIHGA